MIRRTVVLGICLIMAFTVVPFTTGSGEAKAASWNSMKIYGIYMSRDGAAANGSDRYGDAVLIESNGEYLLMDCGEGTLSGYQSNLVKKLKSIGVTELDVYISHMHGDHQGGLKYICDNFKVKNLYLPDIEVCKNYRMPSYESDPVYYYTIEAMYERLLKNVKSGTNVTYLAPSFRSHQNPTTDHFTVGAVNFSVIGPVGTYTVNQFKSQDGNCGSKEGHCLNNCSLTTIATCGSFRYMTAGDIELQEENALISRYGNGLKCDVMKASHHGLYTSNNSGFVSKVAPTWSFEEDHGYFGSTNNAKSNLKSYGYNFGVASSKASFIVDVDNNNVRIYRDWNGNMKADEAPLTGWVNTGKGHQYYNGSGYILKGWQWISGYAYYLGGTSGYRYTGSHKISGVKVKFSSSGKLTSHKKPAKVSAKSAKAKGVGKIKVSWSKASRASRYQIYRSTYKSGGYQYVATVKKSKRSFTNGGLVKGQKYYYKVRAIRYVAGGTMYGSFSKPKKAVAK